MHRDRRVSLHGTGFHYTDWGAESAPPVVLLHGITGHARTWDDEARALSMRYRVLALDLRGHGDSDPAPDGDYTTDAMADDLAAFVDALAPQPVRVVGLSLGGRVAIAYAGRYPQRVSRLVVVDIGPDIAQAGRARVGMLLAGSPERLDNVEHALAYARAANPRYTEAIAPPRNPRGANAARRRCRVEVRPRDPRGRPARPLA